MLFLAGNHVFRYKYKWNTHINETTDNLPNIHKNGLRIQSKSVEGFQGTATHSNHNYP